MSTYPKEHPLRRRIQAEIHARPYRSIITPSLVVRQAFLRPEHLSLENDHLTLLSWCRTFGVDYPTSNIRHFSKNIDGVIFTWERHTEFLSLTWESQANQYSYEALKEIITKHVEVLIRQEANLISCTKIILNKGKPGENIKKDGFQEESLCLSCTENHRARILTDFHEDEFGATQFYVTNFNLSDSQSGVLVTRLLEIDTYRVMALYGFEIAKNLVPEINVIENNIITLTKQVNAKTQLKDYRETLDKVTRIVGNLGDIAASNYFRLSATKAYYNLIQGRLSRLNETSSDGSIVIEEFLARRLAPAMRTCDSIEGRIRTAGQELESSTALLRTKIDLQVQIQSQSVLESMNHRALMQYRLQSTVEGLSIAAISYYIVGLINYIFKGLDTSQYMSKPKLMAVIVPIVVISIWVIIKRLKKVHLDETK